MGLSAKWELVQAALADTQLSSAAKVVFTRLVWHRNKDDGRCNPSYSTLADGCGVNRRTAMVAVAQLEALGWIEVNRNAGVVGLSSNQFVICPRGSEKFCTGTSEKKSPPQGEIFTRGSENSCTGGSEKSCTLTSEDRTSEPLTNESNHRSSLRSDRSRTQNSLFDGLVLNGEKDARSTKLAAKEEDRDRRSTDAHFEEFWRQYPLRVARRAARTAYDAAVKAGGDPSEILAGAMRYSAGRRGQDPKYTKHPSTWLRAGCWTDEVPQDVGLSPGTQGFLNGLARCLEERRAEIEPSYFDTPAGHSSETDFSLRRDEVGWRSQEDRWCGGGNG